MKRFFFIILLCMMIAVMFLPSCNSPEQNGVSFYYCREPSDYRYFEEEGVIRAESRDLAGHRNDLRYMVSLYLAGPMEEGLVSPFTNTTMLISSEITNNQVYIELSGHNKNLTDSEFSLACACLTLTCMDYTPCESVTIISGDRSLTMDADSILIFDTLPLQETTGG